MANKVNNGRVNKYYFYNFKHFNDNNMLNECSICMRKIRKNYVNTKCKHTFHGACLKEWTTRGRNTCPMCRTPNVRFSFSKRLAEKMIQLRKKMREFIQLTTNDNRLQTQVNDFPHYWFPRQTWQNSDGVNQILKTIFITLLLDSENTFKRYMDIYIGIIDDVREIQRIIRLYTHDNLPENQYDDVMDFYIHRIVRPSNSILPLTSDLAESILMSIHVFTELVLNTNPNVVLLWPMFLMKIPRREVVNRHKSQLAVFTPRFTLYKQFVKRLMHGVSFHVNATNNANYYTMFVNKFVKSITSLRKRYSSPE